MNQITLGDLCNIQIGKTPPRDLLELWGGGEPFLSIADMNQGRLISSTKETISSYAASQYNCRLVPANTLLLSFKLSIGKVGFTTRPLYTNEAIAALYIKDARILPEFLFWTLKSIDYDDYADTAAKGKTLNKRKLQGIQIPLPPLAEQRHIAAILDKVDELRAFRRQALVRLDDLAQSVFLNMFGNPGSNPKGWETLPAGDIFEIKLGKMRSAKKITGKYLKPYLRNINVQWGRIDTTSVYEMDFLPPEEERYKLEPGDILVCEGGEVGRTAIFRGEIENCFYQNALHRLRPLKPTIDPEYFVAFMRMASLEGLIAKYTSQVTIAHFTAEKFRAFPVMLPPYDLQLQFSELISQVTKIREHFSGHLAHLSKLSAAIQHQAFT